uniref:Uncharacterized protein n=1 Tax=Plectus sambesii TaxID=2011161 RepID=A0A914W0F4_9BILA
MGRRAIGQHSSARSNGGDGDGGNLRARRGPVEPRPRPLQLCDMSSRRLGGRNPVTALSKSATYSFVVMRRLSVVQLGARQWKRPRARRGTTAAGRAAVGRVINARAICVPPYDGNLKSEPSPPD